MASLLRPTAQLLKHVFDLEYGSLKDQDKKVFKNFLRFVFGNRIFDGKEILGALCGLRKFGIDGSTHFSGLPGAMGSAFDCRLIEGPVD